MARILVVEDSQVLLEMLKVLLHMNGHEVRLVWEEQEARNALATFSPDMVLLDAWTGGGKSGMELCRTIKSTHENLPVLLMSTNPESLKDYQKCRADAVIEKPFDIKKLNEAVEQLLNRR